MMNKLSLMILLLGSMIILGEQPIIDKEIGQNLPSRFISLSSKDSIKLSDSVSKYKQELDSLKLIAVSNLYLLKLQQSVLVTHLDTLNTLTPDYEAQPTYRQDKPTEHCNCSSKSKD